jgi:hypothetical protein
MQIRLPNPRWVVRTIHWINRPLIEGWRAKRIDALLVAQGVGIASYYAYAYGPIGALMGLGSYLFVMMCIMWF